jgi:hypothetical protein
MENLSDRNRQGASLSFRLSSLSRTDKRSNPNRRNRFTPQRRFQLDRLDSKRSRESVAAAAKKNPGSDINILRRSLSYTVHTYSIALTKRNIEALLYAAKINPATDRPGGVEKFFTDEFLLKALGK